MRRKGRHTVPSQVEKVADKAGKAAPAMAIAGVLVAAPQAQHLLARAATVATVQAPRPAAHQQSTTPESLASRGSVSAITASTRHAAARAAARNISYKVHTGDTLSGISKHFYGNAGDWPFIYHQNQTTVADPNLIYTGETLLVPAHVPAGVSPDSYIPKHAKTTPRTAGTGATTTAVTQAGSGGGGGGSRSGAPIGSGGGGGGSHAGAPVGGGGGGGGGGGAGRGSRSGAPQGGGGGGGGYLGGHLDCSGLEDLWDMAGGNPADSFMAAEIAMAESGGNQYAVSPTNDYGYWQINAVWGKLATFNPIGNAKAAIQISQDGTNWTPWTTYNTGAYIGQC